MDVLGDRYNLHRHWSLFDTHWKEDQSLYLELEVESDISSLTFVRNKGPLISTKFGRVILDFCLQLCIHFVNM